MPTAGGLVPVSPSRLHHSWSQVFGIQLTGCLTLKLEGYKQRAWSGLFVIGLTGLLTLKLEGYEK